MLCIELKPLVAIQRVRLPPGKGAARQPEASLAWRAATPVEVDPNRWTGWQRGRCHRDFHVGSSIQLAHSG